MPEYREEKNRGGKKKIRKESNRETQVGDLRYTSDVERSIVIHRKH